MKLTHIKDGEPPRLVCAVCGFIFYLDPKVAACVIIEIENKIVLLKRAIEPSLGKWVIPGGYVDVGEPVTEAALRETWEEVRLRVAIGPLVGVYSYPEATAIVVVYKAFVQDGRMAPGDETLEVRLFALADIPWNQIAFKSTRDALQDYLRTHHPEAPPEPR
ncbi:MAG: NUDIX hydrolase [Desulfobacterales bacterium]|nr:MAG: NUDIX hydrolase [Desulfobacterales bacterium]